MTSKTFNAEFILSRHHVRPVEILPWVLAVLAFFVFPDYLQLGAQVLILILFALSLDLILGYAGIISLGHAALFGTGAYAAGILSAHGKWGEPLTGLVVAAVAASLGVLISVGGILRTRVQSLLKLTMATTILIQEFANQQEEITGGDDGLQGVSMDPLLGLFDFDLVGETAYLYSLAVLFVLFLVVRCIVYSSFGQSLRGIRENVVRMHAIGSPVDRRVLCVYTISAALAGVAGALLAQTTEFVALDVLSFERSGDVLIVIILGGTGRLYGAFIGAPIYLLLQDQLAKWSPEYWLFGIGLVLVLRVIFVPQGLLGLFDTISRRLSGGRG